jgi:hypothetical protein
MGRQRIPFDRTGKQWAPIAQYWYIKENAAALFFHFICDENITRKHNA